jgi:hypothetical protein
MRWKAEEMSNERRHSGVCVNSTYAMTSFMPPTASKVLRPKTPHCFQDGWHQAMLAVDCLQLFSLRFYSPKSKVWLIDSLLGCSDGQYLEDRMSLIFCSSHTYVYAVPSLYKREVSPPWCCHILWCNIQDSGHPALGICVSNLVQLRVEVPIPWLVCDLSLTTGRTKPRISCPSSRTYRSSATTVSYSVTKNWTKAFMISLSVSMEGPLSIYHLRDNATLPLIACL